MIDPDIRAHYDLGLERERLSRDGVSLEFVRTQELLRRYLPPPPADILDVGGGPGRYAIALAARLCCDAGRSRPRLSRTRPGKSGGDGR